MNGRPNQRIESRILMSENRKRWIIGLAVTEVLLAAAAIGTCIATLIYSTGGREELYNDIVDYYISGYYSPYLSPSYYDYNNGLYTFSLTSQGIWAGSFAIIAASMNFEMARFPTTTNKSYSIGFLSWSTALSLTMLALEATAVSWIGAYGVPYASVLWNLHVALLTLSVLLSILIISSLVVTCTVYDGGSGGCCGNSAPVMYSDTANGASVVVLPGNVQMQQMSIPLTMVNPGVAGLEQRVTASPPIINTAPYFTVPQVQQQQAIPLVIQQPNPYLGAPVSNELAHTDQAVGIAEGFQKMNPSS